MKALGFTSRGHGYAAQHLSPGEAEWSLEESQMLFSEGGLVPPHRAVRVQGCANVPFRALEFRHKIEERWTLTFETRDEARSTIQESSQRELYIFDPILMLRPGQIVVVYARNDSNRPLVFYGSMWGEQA